MSVTTKLTGRWFKTAGGTWCVKTEGQVNVGDVIEVTRRDGKVNDCIVTSIINEWTDYTLCGVSEVDSAEQEATPDLIPVPVVPVATLNRGDLVTKTINGVVKVVETRNAVPMADIVWDRGPLKQSMMTCEIEAEQTSTEGSVDSSVVDALKIQIEALQAQVANKEIMEVVLKDKDGTEIKTIKDMFHSCFPKLVQLVQARKNVFIYGPTGCGKSHICKQVAEALNLRFAFVSCTSGMSEGVLGGRLLPVGKSGTFQYVISEFISCYEEGGLFLLDEIDAADPNVLLLVNAALANGHVSVPNRPEKPYAVRHPDFICVAAANTVGTGADRLYSGRNKLDAATLDRFAIGKICMNYDERVDALLCPDETLRNKLQGYRKLILDHRMERAMSTRFMRDAYDMLQVGWSLKDIDEAFFSGWRQDEISKVKGGAK